MYNYSIKFINSQIYKKTLLLCVILLIASIFFPIKHTFITPESFLTGDYSDFTSFTLYLSDILLFTTCFFVILPRGGEFYHVVKSLKWLILAIFLVFFINFGQHGKLNLYWLIKWVELFVSYGTFVLLFRDIRLKSLFLSLFSWFCGIQSIISILQFTNQKSLGLYKLGESHLSPIIQGVAKIVSGGTTYIRGYGTFPHPNPLSAFLVVGILISIYLFISSTKLKSKITYGILIFLNIIGLTTTFSRGAFLSLGLGLILFFAWLFWKKIEQAKISALLVGLAILFSIVVFKPFLISRATFSDQSTIDRKFYNSIGINMAKSNPLSGVGMGESLLHMEQLSGKNLEPWQKQPPHNYFIITSAELGIPVMLMLIWIFITHLWRLIKKLKLEASFTPTTHYPLLTTIMLCIIFLIQFDHYFYTLQQTQLLLWIFLAFVSSETKNPQSLNGRGDTGTY